MKLKQILLSTTVVASYLYFSNAACAQDTTAPQTVASHDVGGITEIVVTAQRTQSLASKTPVALTAVSGDNLRKDGIDSPSALGQRVPNLQMDVSGTALRITIRGVSSQDTTEKGDPSAAFMMDGIYIARPDVQNVSFYDINRVEVLRGPQGTLYGRNTTAGAINVLSNDPKWSTEGNLHVTLGNFGTRNVDGMFNTPLNDKVALRGAFALNKHDSYIINGQGTGYNMPGNRDDASGRLSAKLKLTDNLTVLVRTDYSQIKTIAQDISSSNFYHDALTTSPVYYDDGSKAARTFSFLPAVYGAAALQPYHTDNSTWGAGVELNWNLGPVNLTYQGAHRYFERYELGNSILSGVLGSRTIMHGKYNQDSHELRVATTSDGPLKAQAGVYYFKEVSNIVFTLRDLDAFVTTPYAVGSVPAGSPVPYFSFPQGPTTSISRAAFAQTTYKLTDTFRLTAGIRYSEDEKSRFGATSYQQAEVFNPSTDYQYLNAATIRTHKIIGRLGADYDINAKTLWYAVISTGYKAGGFNDGCLAGTTVNGLACSPDVAKPASLLFYQPEELLSYETGIKTKFWGNRARLNANVFSYDYTNLQLSGVVYVGNAPQLSTTNAARAKVNGLEVEGEVVPMPADHITYSLALLDAKYTQYSPDGVADWSGVSLDRSPKTVVTLGYDHRFTLTGGSLTVGAFTRWTDKYIISVPSAVTRYNIPAFSKTDLTATYRPSSEKWDVQIYVKNLEDKVYPVSVGTGVASPSEPLTMGVRLGVTF